MKLMVVDAENCLSCELIRHIDYKRNWEVILVAGKTQSFTLNKNSTIKVDRCDIIGHNAADFRVVALVSHKVFTGNYSEVVIVSNDKGFESAINYMNEQGIKVRRLSSKYVIGRFKITKSEELVPELNKKPKEIINDSGELVNKAINHKYLIKLRQDLIEISKHPNNTNCIKKFGDKETKEKYEDTLKIARYFARQKKNHKQFNEVVHWLNEKHPLMDIRTEFVRLTNMKILKVFREDRSRKYIMSWNSERVQKLCKLNGGY